ncbi:MCE family protein [Haloechinothrix sp. YIM 98757]|uniref:MCE family protein n=1 Tax=Haloechinothrix aidingensis TaxID=2752311 RepID=A0A838ACA4_9PSEU|nr:MlaD family protein [Haloechinothrix aidingensis]MBA0126857.1 MCE family protein [Haloechinothrix aidingensis]
MRRIAVLVGVAALVAAAVGGVSLANDEDYTVDVVLPTATNLNSGSPVLIDGFRSGSLADVRAQDGHARLTLEIDGSHAPLHDGAKVTVKWKSLVGERFVEVHDGPQENATIPAGGMLKGKMPEPMEVDQVLAALDEPTRERLNSLISSLNTTVGGHEQDLQATLESAGPALQALGEVLKGIGADGEAISQIVSQLNDMTGTLAADDGKVRAIVQNLSQLSADVAEERQKLGQSLEKLPETVERADDTLGKVPGVVDEASPLLEELEPATDRLPSVARNLEPVLTELRPVMDRLRPTLRSADEALAGTPAMLDSARDVLPGTEAVVEGLLEPLDFLRPYTPEAAGVFTNWNSAAGNYTGTGHYARFNVLGGAMTPGVNPGVVPPGFESNRQPAPGALVGQPWRDAQGSGVR